jgi:hypothetical protein
VYRYLYGRWQSRRLKLMGTAWKTQPRTSTSVARMVKAPTCSRTYRSMDGSANFVCK